MARILVGMSGGVDSAVTAWLLKARGYEVIGATLKLFTDPKGADSRCCEIDDARRVAGLLGIPYYVIPCMPEFTRSVIEPFVAEYLKGQTPNPCVVCNRVIKWDQMLKAADRLGADYVATGHYAALVQKDNGRFTVRQSDYMQKDQTYMLYRLSQDQLKRTLMPLAGITKSQVRDLAEKAGLGLEKKADSQEICFVTEGRYADFVRDHMGDEEVTEGNFVDVSGKVLGRHKGIIHYTVGQRKGLGIALGVPAYVKEIRPQTNEVVIASDEDLYADRILVSDLNWMSLPALKCGEEIVAKVRIRYHHAGERACIRALKEDLAEVVFDRPVRAPAPGQSAVFYDETACVIGGGFIRPCTG